MPKTATPTARKVPAKKVAPTGNARLTAAQKKLQTAFKKLNDVNQTAFDTGDWTAAFKRLETAKLPRPWALVGPAPVITTEMRVTALDAAVKVAGHKGRVEVLKAANEFMLFLRG